MGREQLLKTLCESEASSGPSTSRNGRRCTRALEDPSPLLSHSQVGWSHQPGSTESQPLLAASSCWQWSWQKVTHALIHLPLFPSEAFLLIWGQFGRTEVSKRHPYASKGQDGWRSLEPQEKDGGSLKCNMT